MSPEAEARLARARETRDSGEADRIAVEAIVLAPDFGAAYAFRGRLAAERGDPVVAAHHFRAAFARGDRSVETRAGLSICLDAAGEDKLAARVWTGGPKPRQFEDFAETVLTQATPIRQMLAAPLPGQGTPALLPGERTPAPARVATPAPAPSRPPGPAAPRRGPTSAPPLRAGIVSRTPIPRQPSSGAPAARAGVVVQRRGPSTKDGRIDDQPTRPDPKPPEGALRQATPAVGVVRRPSRPPAARSPQVSGISMPPGPEPLDETPSRPPAALSGAPPADARGPSPRLSSLGRAPSSPPSRPSDAPPRTRSLDLPPENTEQRLVRRSSKKSDWVENIAPFESKGATSGAADWVQGLELATEHGTGGPRIDASTGLELAIDPGEVSFQMRSPVTGELVDAGRTEGLMPDLASTSDPLEALHDFEATLREGMQVAVRLPGPVMTALGAAPQQLCRAVSVGLTDTEVIMRDEDRGDAGIVRLVFDTLTRIEFVHNGQQVSFHLPDQRVVHLDLRGLRSRDWTASSQFLRHLEEVLSR